MVAVATTRQPQHIPHLGSKATHKKTMGFGVVPKSNAKAFRSNGGANALNDTKAVKQRWSKAHNVAIAQTLEPNAPLRTNAKGAKEPNARAKMATEWA